jgi:glycosyltransferase involved in cell wall biosynthesis
MNRYPVVNQENILVTVCVLSYNRAEGMDKVLNCLTQQTHKNLQIVVSDDCSPDANVSKVIESHAERDPRIEYHLQVKNIYYYKNLKFVLDKSVGEFVMWCDDDDWYDPTYIQKCLSALLKTETALTAFTYYSEVDESGVLDSRYPNQSKLLERLSRKNKYLRMLAYLFTFDGYGYCNIYYGLHRKQILSWFDPENYGYSIDMDVGMKLISIGPVALVREELFKKTVGNVKKYNSPHLHENKKLVFADLWFKNMSLLKGCISRINIYCRILRLHQSLFILLLSPFWIVSKIALSATKYFGKVLRT